MLKLQTICTVFLLSQLVILATTLGCLVNIYYFYYRPLFHWSRASDKGRENAASSPARTEPTVLPNTLIIGAAKCGTRAVLKYLSFHPDVQIAPEETAFFAHDGLYRLGPSWYAQKCHFNSIPAQVRVEKSPQYFITAKAPEKVYKLNSSMRIILVVRDPVRRLISDYSQRVEQSNNFEKPLDGLVYSKREKGLIDSESRIVNVGIYHLHLSKWLKYFPKSRIHIINGESLAKDNPYNEMCALERFLGLPNFYTETSFMFNSRKGFYCLVDSGTFRCLGDNKGRAHTAAHPAIKEDLRQFYKQPNKMFFSQIGKQFNWSSN